MKISFLNNQYLQIFKSRRIVVIAFLGFSSGLPLALTSGTLQAWMTVDGVDIKTIGFFSLVGLPYTLKFIWSPLMDRFVPLKIGRRRGWILITQFAIMSGIILMAFNSPSKTPLLMAMLALLVSFSSASQDIVVDAYRTDVLREKERGIGAAVSVTGYRIAMLISGALALVMSETIGWNNTYMIMAVMMTIGIISTTIGEEPDNQTVHPKNMQESIWGPLKDYFSKDSALALLLLIVLYKLGDAYAGSLTTAFLIRGVGFSAGEVGTINKGLGLISSIGGAIFGGTLMVRLGLFRSLMIFGILQAISNLSFMFLSWIGKNYAMLIFTVAFENTSGGMGTAAFVSLLMSICSHRYSATQYALLSSIAAVGRTFIAPSSGFVVESIGWSGFFFITTVSAIPGLAILWWMKNSIIRLKNG